LSLCLLSAKHQSRSLFEKLKAKSSKQSLCAKILGFKLTRAKLWYSKSTESRLHFSKWFLISAIEASS